MGNTRKWKFVPPRNEILSGYAMKRVIFSIISLSLFLLASPVIPSALAADVTLAWDANPPEDHVDGYILYYRLGSNDGPEGMDAYQGPSPIVIPLEELGNPSFPEYKLTGLRDDEEYWFSVKAYNNAGESQNSNWVGYPYYTFTGEEGGGCFINIVGHSFSRSR
jgi:hypothetical protein